MAIHCPSQSAAKTEPQPGPSFLWFGLASGSTWALFKTINVDPTYPVQIVIASKRSASSFGIPPNFIEDSGGDE